MRYYGYLDTLINSEFAWMPVFPIFSSNQYSKMHEHTNFIEVVYITFDKLESESGVILGSSWFYFYTSGVNAVALWAF